MAGRARITAAQVQAGGETWLELVAEPNSVELYVEDDGEPMATAQMTGKVIVLQGAQKTEYTLKPAGGNKLGRRPSASSKPVAFVGPCFNKG